jgi:hypothetical protein
VPSRSSIPQLGGVMPEKLAELFDEERGSQTRVRNRRVA